jgi:hypothetical protein
MKLFFIRDKATGLYLEWDRTVQNWVATRDEASLYRSRERAETAIEGLENWLGDYEIEEIDTDAAIQVLRDLFEAGDLDDHFYAIREREGRGWEGPRMVKWGNAVERAKALMEKHP